MNKKGFTLIELLAVVTIIALISALAIPNIVKTIREKKSEISSANMKLLTSSAEVYIENNQGKYTYSYEADGSTYCIPIQTLIDKNYLETPFKDISGQEIDYSKQLKAIYEAEYNSFDYELVDNSECTELIQYISRPRLADNMIPVIYDENTNKWLKANENTRWYNYTQKKWANAVLVKEQKETQNSKSRYDYKNAPAGTEILEDDILAIFVWIPRFRYQLFESNVNQQINIVFESIATTKSTGTTQGEWLTHPAFTYNNQELSGIWVAKYESSNNSDNVIIKANQTPWTNISYIDANEKSIGMTSNINIYGLKNVNTHMTRNSEWGALAYLTNSEYGNLQNDSTTGNITGIYNLSGNKEYVTIDNENENSLGYALNETKTWTTNNSYTTTENVYLTRGNNSIFNYQNSNIVDTSATFRVSITNVEAQDQSYRNNLMIAYDYNMNLISGVENQASTSFSKGTYSISSGTISVTASSNDAALTTPGTVYLEAGKKYTFNCDTDGTWGTGTTDTVEAYLLKDGTNTTSYRMAQNKYYEFAPKETGTYSLRVDVNKSGKTHSFSNISVKEIHTPKQVAHGDLYGELPTPTPKQNYTFIGWNGKNLFNKDATSINTGKYIKGDGTTASNTEFSIYQVEVKPNTTYTITNSGKSSAPGYVIYNSSGTRLAGANYANTAIITFTTPANASYIKLSVATNNTSNRYDKETFQLEEGTTATLYEPYYVTNTIQVTQLKNHTLKAIWQAN